MKKNNSNASDQPQSAPVVAKKARTDSFVGSNGTVDDHSRLLDCVTNNAPLVDKAHLDHDRALAATCVVQTTLPLATVVQEQDKTKQMVTSVAKQGRSLAGLCYEDQPEEDEIVDLKTHPIDTKVLDTDRFRQRPMQEVFQVERAHSTNSSISMDSPSNLDHANHDDDARRRRRSQRQAAITVMVRQQCRLLNMIMIQQTHAIERQLLEDQQRWQRQQAAAALQEDTRSVQQQQNQQQQIHRHPAAIAGMINNNNNNNNNINNSRTATSSRVATTSNRMAAFQKLAAQQLADQQMLAMQHDQESMKIWRSLHYRSDLSSSSS
jgi:hypothetical protein